MAYAINVRPQQLSADGTEVRVYRTNYLRAIRLIDNRVMLYRPRDEGQSGYFGVACITHVEIDNHDPKWIWISMGNIKPFERPVPLNELYGAVFTNDTPFHTYAQTLRVISRYEMDRLLEVEEVAHAIGLYEGGYETNGEAASPTWAVRKVRRRQKLIRDQLISLYGPRCVLTEKLYTNPSGRIFETQTGHLIGLAYRGPDIIQNALPMSSVSNWHWDNGVVALTNAGSILLSSRASSDAKSLFEHGRRVRFANSDVWPKAEFLEWHRDNVFEKGYQPGLVWQGKDARF